MNDFPVIPVNRHALSCRKPVFGVGINDADYKTSPVINGKQYQCIVYRVWRHMMERCYSPEWHARQPTYIGCTVDERWHSFMSFREWYLSQPNCFDLCLDKDILYPGNKIYGPDTCVMVTYAVNNFYTNIKSGTHKYSLGVACLNGKYRAEVSVGTGKRWRSQFYLTADEASSAYHAKRREIGLALASVQTDKRVADAIIASLK